MLRLLPSTRRCGRCARTGAPGCRLQQQRCRHLGKPDARLAHDHPIDDRVVPHSGPPRPAVPASGAGSLDALAQDPVATAASNTPELSTLVTAVKKADLAGTLNTAEGITVFAPTNDAFAAVPKATSTRLWRP